MSRAIPAMAPTTSQTFSPTTVKAALAQVTKCARVAHRGRGHGAANAKANDLQLIIDADLFCLQPDRRTKLTPYQQYTVLQLLAQFFTERSEDAHRYAYFEAIFFGREGEKDVHDFRINILVQLASFALQYPVLPVFNHIAQWLGKVNNQKMARQYSEKVVEVLVEHYIRSPGKESKESSSMYEFLMPLESSCAEFTAIFITLAPLQVDMNLPLSRVLTAYLTKNLGFVLRHLRDTPYLGEDFATNTMPLLLKYASVDDGDDETKKIRDGLRSCLCDIIEKWNGKVITGRPNTTKQDLNLEVLASVDLPWTEGRRVLLREAFGSDVYKKDIRMKLAKLKVPSLYQDILD